MIYKQKLAKALGDEGCYFLSLLWLAERELGREFDAIGTFAHFCAKGYAGEDCYMANPAAMMSDLLGKPCSVRKSWDFGYRLKDSEREVRCFVREAVGHTYYHFAAMDSAGNVAYDPLENSNTIRLGRAHSRRILSIADS